MKNHKIFFAAVILLLITCVALLIIKKNEKETALNSTVNTANETSYIKEGFVIFKNSQIYFVENNEIDNSNKSIEEIKNKQHPSDSILISHNPNLLKNIKSGDKIKIWFKQVLESYPQKLIIEKCQKLKT